MASTQILLPVFVQILLTFFLLFWMGFHRVRTISKGETRISDIALGQPGWPIKATKIANCYHNQLQMPVLFYVLVGAALYFQKVDWLLIALAWGYVASRVIHMFIHTSSNHVVHRFYAFLLSNIILLIMWGVFMARIVTAGF